jgi:hypothetical protein
VSRVRATERGLFPRVAPCTPILSAAPVPCPCRRGQRPGPSAREPC